MLQVKKGTQHTRKLTDGAYNWYQTSVYSFRRHFLIIIWIICTVLADMFLETSVGCHHGWCGWNHSGCQIWIRFNHGIYPNLVLYFFTFLIINMLISAADLISTRDILYEVGNLETKSIFCLPTFKNHKLYQELYQTPFIKATIFR